MLATRKNKGSKGARRALKGQESGHKGAAWLKIRYSAASCDSLPAAAISFGKLGLNVSLPPIAYNCILDLRVSKIAYFSLLLANTAPLFAEKLLPISFIEVHTIPCYVARLHKIKWIRVCQPFIRLFCFDLFIKGQKQVLLVFIP